MVTAVLLLRRLLWLLSTRCDTCGAHIGSTPGCPECEDLRAHAQTYSP